MSMCESSPVRQKLL